MLNLILCENRLYFIDSF